MDRTILSKRFQPCTHRGHPIERISGNWVYSDNKELVINDETRICNYCKKSRTKEGHDDCLGTLPSVMNACCGHGNIKDTYIQFLDGFGVYGEDARIIIDILKRIKG